jgi:cupin fold WbuC family metalloprotein
MNVREINPEVFYATDRIVCVTDADLGFIQEKAAVSPRRRARVCAHRGVDDKLHEMIVVLKQDSYLTPEKHEVKVESYHIIKGIADVVIFDDAGNVTAVVQMGDHASGRAFYYRLSDPSFYHTLIIRSESLVYHETATGPFQKSDTVIAPWAPAENDLTGRRVYMEQLEKRVQGFLDAA